MLPNHSPLVIAEQFGTLATLHPGRIDLGLGRAPGSDTAAMRALRRDELSSERFPQDVVELQGLLGETARSPASSRSPARAPTCRSTSSAPRSSAPSSPRSSDCPTPSPRTSRRTRSSTRCRSTARTSSPPTQLAEPYAMAGVGVIAAADKASAEAQLEITRRARVKNLFKTPGGGKLIEEEVDEILASPRAAAVDEMLTYSAVGTGERSRRLPRRFPGEDRRRGADHGPLRRLGRQPGALGRDPRRGDEPQRHPRRRLAHERVRSFPRFPRFSANSTLGEPRDGFGRGCRGGRSRPRVRSRRGRCGRRRRACRRRGPTRSRSGRPRAPGSGPARSPSARAPSRNGSGSGLPRVIASAVIIVGGRLEARAAQPRRRQLGRAAGDDRDRDRPGQQLRGPRVGGHRLRRPRPRRGRASPARPRVRPPGPAARSSPGSACPSRSGRLLLVEPPPPRQRAPGPLGPRRPSRSASRRGRRGSRRGPRCRCHSPVDPRKKVRRPAD